MLLIFLLFSKLVAKISLEFIFQNEKTFISFEKEVKSCKYYTSDELKNFFNSLKMERLKASVFRLFDKIKNNSSINFEISCHNIQYYFFEDLKEELEKSEIFKALSFKNFCCFFLFSLFCCVAKFLKEHEEHERRNEYVEIVDKIFDVFLDDFINKREGCIKKSTNESDKIFQTDEKLKADRVLIKNLFKDIFKTLKARIEEINNNKQRKKIINAEKVERENFEDEEMRSFLEIKKFCEEQNS